MAVSPKRQNLWALGHVARVCASGLFHSHATSAPGVNFSRISEEDNPNP